MTGATIGVFLVGAVLPPLADHLGRLVHAPWELETPLYLLGWSALVGRGAWIAQRRSSMWRATGRVTVVYLTGVVSAMMILGAGNIWPVALAFQLLFGLTAGVVGGALGRSFP
jgi:hypothetical protein